MLLIETLLLAAAASAPAVWLVYALPRMVRASMPSMPSYPFHVDGAVLTYLVGVALLAGVFAGVAPAIEALKQDVVGALHGDETIASRGSRTRRYAGRGSGRRLSRVARRRRSVRARGISDGPRLARLRRRSHPARCASDQRDAGGVALGGVTLYPDARRSGFDRLAVFERSRLRAPRRSFVRRRVTPPPAVRLLSPSAGPTVAATRNVVSPDFFATLRLPILQGRAFEERRHRR